MSGTPALSRPAELFSQISAINPNLFNNFHEFGVRYCDGKETKFGMDYSGYSNMNELKTILEENLLIRREKKDVMSELPSKMRETIILNPALIELNSKTLKKAMEHLKLLQEIEKEGGKAGMDKHGALLKAVIFFVLDF
jgi:SWI/SNF-related matrix-associated actin-dependent regulator 1 of chromatin subfamily A